VGSLRQIGTYLCDLHGQHAHQWLLDPLSHGEFLDGFVPVAVRERYREAFAQRQRCGEARRQAEADLATARQHKEFWAFQLAELERVNPQAGEYEALREQRSEIRSAERSSELHRLLEAELTAADDSILPRLSDLEVRLRQVGEPSAQLQRWAELLSQARMVLAEISTELARHSLAGEEPEAAVESIEARLHALYKLKKKFNDSIEDAIAQRDIIRINLQRLSDAEAELRPLRVAEERASVTLAAAGHELHAARKAAVVNLIGALRRPLEELGLPGDSISVRLCPLEREQWQQGGGDEVEFMLAANPGEEPKPLARIVSGGELSRVMLALKSVLPGSDRVETLVFDEVDSGIGAETAAAVADRLQALARGRQVIVITHLHPIAARSEHHWLVEKKRVRGRQVPVIRRLDTEGRVEALSRLIAGGAATPQARAAARTLVAKPRSD
jgi:DNA repair protein RecN (Recombination protein N)